MRQVTSPLMLSFIALTIGLASCSDATSPGTGVDLWPFNDLGSFLKPGNPSHGQIYIYTETSAAGVTKHNLGGQLFNNTDHDTAVLGGSMTAAGESISEPSSIGPYVSFKTPTLGQTLAFGLSGNGTHGVPSFTDSLYIPSPIKVTGPVIDSVSASAGLTITWNTDSGNDSVLIGIEYDADFNELAVNPLFNYPDYRWWTLTNDNGSYTIPSSVMANLTPGTRITVLVGRGRSKSSGTTSYPVDIYGYSSGRERYWVKP